MVVEMTKEMDKLFNANKSTVGRKISKIEDIKQAREANTITQLKLDLRDSKV